MSKKNPRRGHGRGTYTENTTQEVFLNQTYQTLVIFRDATGGSQDLVR